MKVLDRYVATSFVAVALYVAWLGATPPAKTTDAPSALVLMVEVTAYPGHDQADLDWLRGLVGAEYSADMNHTRRLERPYEDKQLNAAILRGLAAKYNIGP